MRKQARIFHRVIGVLCSGVFFVLCVSGCLLLFRGEIERLVDFPRYIAEPSGESPRLLSLDTIREKMEKETGGTTETIVWSRNPRRTWRLLLKNGDDPRSRLLFDVDPYTGNVKGQGQEKTAPFFRWVRMVHTTLGLPKKLGRPLVLGATILSLPLLLTGLILWTPVSKRPWKSWRERLTIRWTAGKKRLLFDFHRALGAYLFLPVAVLAVTGIFLSFYPHGATVGRIFPGDTLEITSRDEKTRGENESDPLETILKKQRERYPAGNEIIFRIPEKGTSKPILLETTRGGWRFFTIAEVTYWDTFDARFRSAKTFADLSSRQRFSALTRPLHDGSIFGLLSKIFYFFACAGAGSLSITGIILWGRRNGQKEKRTGR